MKVITIRPYQQPIVEEIDNTLKSMQAVVGGYIEAIYPWEDEIALICNEEGKINGLPLNRILTNEDGAIVDYIAGTFFLCSAPMDSENFTNIPEELIDKYINIFKF